MSDKLDFPIGYVKGGTKVWIRNESDVQDVCNLYVVVTMFHYGTMVFMVPSASKKHHSSESSGDSDDSSTKKPKKK